MHVQPSCGCGGDVLCVQAEQSHGDFCLLHVHRDTYDALVPTSMITQVVWLVQLVTTAGTVIALHAGQRADTRNFHECRGLQHGEMQMCVFIMSPERACKYTPACLYS